MNWLIHILFHLEIMLTDAGNLWWLGMKTSRIPIVWRQLTFDPWEINHKWEVPIPGKGSVRSPVHFERC